MHRRLPRLLAIGFLSACLLVILYQLPPVHSRLAWRVDELKARLKYALNPPEEAIFVPQQQSLPSPLVHTVQYTPTPTVTPNSPLPTPIVTRNLPLVTSTPAPTPIPSPTPLPGEVILSGVKYEDQHNRWNYCGPANFSMALTFWGWKGNRDVVGKYVKPADKDKNVMPYEFADFVATQTEGLSVLIRFGGDLNLVKRMVAGGFPVLIEKGYTERDYTGKVGWLGHYQFVNGYNDDRQVFIVQDTYIKDGKDHEAPYADFLVGWQSFNYLFIIVYPSDRAVEVFTLLGQWGDPAWASAHALELAVTEAQTTSGREQFFAWFNQGTSHVALQQYFDAAIAYDYAFSLYAALPEEVGRPYRVMWYQTGPYKAYYYSGRYQDVINLANTTLHDTISEPVLEESFYWRALAKEALGDITAAIDDLKESVRLNPHFTAGLEQLARLGVTP